MKLGKRSRGRQLENVYALAVEVCLLGVQVVGGGIVDDLFIYAGFIGIVIPFRRHHGKGGRSWLALFADSETPPVRHRWFGRWWGSLFIVSFFYWFPAVLEILFFPRSTLRSIRVMGYIDSGFFSLFFGFMYFVFLLNIDAPRRFTPRDMGKRILGKIDRKTQKILTYRTAALAWLPWYVGFSFTF